MVRFLLTFVSLKLLSHSDFWDRWPNLLHAMACVCWAVIHLILCRLTWGYASVAGYWTAFPFILVLALPIPTFYSYQRVQNSPCLSPWRGVSVSLNINLAWPMMILLHEGSFRTRPCLWHIAAGEHLVHMEGSLSRFPLVGPSSNFFSWYFLPVFTRIVSLQVTFIVIL